MSYLAQKQLLFTQTSKLHDKTGKTPAETAGEIIIHVLQLRACGYQSFTSLIAFIFCKILYKPL